MIIKKEIQYSYYRIRKFIGLLGILLPVLVVAFHGDFLSSISHYYYTKSAVFFISILFAFGILLISYKGYEIEKGDKLSDNIITHIAGLAVLLVVFFPTSCLNSNSLVINYMCLSNEYPLFGHGNSVINTIHLISAGIFLFTMGWMSIFRFTRTSKEENRWVYRICGYTIWISLSILIIEFIIKLFYSDFNITSYDVYILETISIFSFGISWLIKGEAIKDIIDLKSKIFSRLTNK